MQPRAHLAPCAAGTVHSAACLAAGVLTAAACRCGAAAWPLSTCCCRRAPPWTCRMQSLAGNAPHVGSASLSSLAAPVQDCSGSADPDGSCMQDCAALRTVLRQPAGGCAAAGSWGCSGQWGRPQGASLAVGPSSSLAALIKPPYCCWVSCWQPAGLIRQTAAHDTKGMCA